MAHRPTSEGIQHVWEVPTRGVLRGTPVTKMPTDALYDALNVHLRNGTLRPRPGLAPHSAVDLLDRPMGVFSSTSIAAGAFQSDAFQNDAFQVSANVPSSTLMLATTKRIWAFFGGAWNDITNTLLTGSEATPARFTMIEISGVLRTLICNGLDTPRQWDGAAATVSDVAGTPPTFADFATASDRIIGIIPPFAIRWGNALDIGTWPAANVRSLSDTPDPLRAIRPVGTQAVVVFKAKSFWSGLPTGGTDAGAFRFEPRVVNSEGPAGSAAVVGSPDGVYVFMTNAGRVGVYDGYRVGWPVDGAWPIVQADFDTTNASRVWGAYDPVLDAVIFYYPRIGDGGAIKGALLVEPPHPTRGINTWIAFPLRMSVDVSAGTDRTTDARDILIARADTRRSRLWTPDSDDDGVGFSGNWQTGLLPLSGGDSHRLDNIETFVERGAGYGNLTLRSVTSDQLAAEGGTLGSAVTIDLTDTSVKEAKGLNVRGRFVGLRYEFTTPITLRYQGATLSARRLE